MIPIEELKIAMSCRGDCTYIDLKVKPGANKDEIIDVLNHRLRVSLKAEAQDGKANNALIKLIAKFFSVGKSSVTLVSGSRSRLKTIKIDARFDELLEKI